MTAFWSFYDLIPITLAQSLIYAFVALGIMLPFRILNFPDMTAEGAFPLGGSICAAFLASGLSPMVGMAVAAVGGALAGASTAIIHLRFRINSLLAGILVMTMLYSLNLHILGRPNVALFKYPTLFNSIAYFGPGSLAGKIVVLSLLVATVFFLLLYLLLTERGVGVRAAGSNPEMAEAYGVSVGSITVAGVATAGACSAFGGSLLVQSQGFVDVGMGIGVLVNGLASLIIGESLLGRRRVINQLAAPVVGSILYPQMVSVCLAIGLPPSDLRFATGLLVLVALALPILRKRGTAPAMREKVRA
ncbi:ABC transporter permease [Bradyrhizobium sp. IC3069]|uniref:ABC transporter permease n=1 Tax=Bradyrhizobium TaxID=374 RepID=UPI001CD71CD3|nr:MULTISPECIES: ABC transporter permease [Bradyrhizobium]MCA1365369.1 ABC transporter permease [Bradyrhizobium sp. IC4059]MCA1522870.1 ABC transporter permease [Bradyrhizobium sp. IC3069]MCA1529417.1 ABC transporter permease [Bradyrhizobium yuanmingense]MCA1550102.1 ABC transporter permease [Bradyrhizobium sp. BRP19]